VEDKKTAKKKANGRAKKLAKKAKK